MGFYIRQRLQQIQEELQAKLNLINYEIQDFAQGLEGFSFEEKQKRIREMQPGKRLSTEVLTMNYKIKSNLEREIDEIKEYLYYNR